MADAGRNPEILTPEQVEQRLPVLWQALDEFNRGLFFRSHETLEELWLVMPPPHRDMLQGIIQAAAALVHLARGEYNGTIRLLDAALQRLRPFQPHALGVDVAAFVADLERALADVQRLGPAGFAGIERTRLPHARYDREA